MFCRKCGAQIAEGVNSCPKCGTAVGDGKLVWQPMATPASTVEPEPVKSTEADANNYFGAPKITCPNCHSQDVMPVTETKTEVSGGGYGVGKGCCGWILLGPLGLLCGLCGTGVKSKSHTQLFWACRSCGHKFRTAEDIKREEAENTAAEMQRMLGGSLVLYVGGNLLADQGWTFFGIPNWIFITLGTLGAIVSIAGFLFPISNRIEEIKNEQEKAKAVFGIASAGLALGILSFVGGILFSIGEIRVFWIPAWVYIFLGVIGALISGIAMFITWMLSLNEEEAERYEKKAERFIERHKGIFDFIDEKVFRKK